MTRRSDVVAVALPGALAIGVLLGGGWWQFVWLGLLAAIAVVMWLLLIQALEAIDEATLTATRIAMHSATIAVRTVEIDNQTQEVVEALAAASLHLTTTERMNAEYAVAISRVARSALAALRDHDEDSAEELSNEWWDAWAVYSEQHPG